MWYGNRILQDYNGKHVFTTVYEADAFVPLARLVWLEDKLTEAANDENVPKVDTAKLDQLKQVALQNIGELEGLDLDQTSIHQACNDELLKHTQHQVYWYQNDHLGTPRELTSNSGNIEWEAVYQAWGNTVTIEWQEVELQPIELNGIEKSYLLQPHRFQGQIYDVETGLHYNRFRYYDPDAGRFISHDPIGLLGGDNQFQYAPNPVEWVDLFGLAKGKSFGSGKGTHHATVKVTDGQGNQIGPTRNFQSGNMTPEEKQLGFPKNSLATHTEARATRNVPLTQGQTMTIDGEYPPCNSCKGKMRAKAESTGGKVTYNWEEDGEKKSRSWGGECP